MKKKSLLFTGLFIAGCAFSQEKLPTSGPGVIDGPTVVVTATSFKETKALNLIFSQDEIDKMDFEKAKEMPDRAYRKPQTFKYSTLDGAEYGNDSSSMQTVMGDKQPLSVIKQWSGLDGGYSPQDPTGAAGLTKYVQSVNDAPFAVYEKSGTGTPVFTGDIGTVTGASNQMGDPIVLYDKFADRWFVAELDGWGNDFALAVSQTNDPAGAYYAYQFTAPQMPDYLKFSVWENGYYMTSNNGAGTVYCFERAAMLTGTPGARAIYKNFTEPYNAGDGFWLPLSADADGLIPPSGTRCPFFAYTDNGWGGSEIDAVKVWSMGVTWGATPAADITLDATLPTAAFDASYDYNWDDITQPGTQKLDGLGGVCMYRAQWSSFIGTNRVVLNWAVKISATQRSIKWVELRQDQSSEIWSLYQEGIYTPDATNRWCGSMAMDCNGDIALCYAKASSTISACLAYTGRLYSDPLGTMSLAETVVFPGSGSIGGGGDNRFGDYSQTSIDPVDGNTFWHTGMYSSGGSATGIYSFQIAPCIVGIDGEEATESEFTVYQSDNIINVKVSGLPADDEYVVQLYDISGKKISENKINSISKSFEATIDVKGLISGMYLVRIGTPDFQRVAKVALQ
ncbi:MAG: T9SS type A sorting domain-containing protein [Bacteroidota bacterium]